MTMIYIVPIEPIDQRYTLQWYTNIPKMLQEYGSDVHVIAGEQLSRNTTSGAFLDFAVTNHYKASQIMRISKLFTDGMIRAGDKFLITDAWNIAVTSIRYMSDLLHIPVEIHGIWHAGAYDPTDILGMDMQKPWPWHQETAWFHACDYNYFATNFHADMFIRNLDINPSYKNKIVISGQPHEIMTRKLAEFDISNKVNTVIWPHRYNKDKQPEIAEDLKFQYASKNIHWLITQKNNLSKQGYYTAMSQTKAIFSCSLHENLGISIMEAVLLNNVPILPDRCSYSEMYLKEFLYPSTWTSSIDNYYKYKNNLIEFIDNVLINYIQYQDLLQQQKEILLDKYLNATVMYKNLCAIADS